uniref:Forkhead-associated domain-containing protein 1 isoform X2 n=1 Tax=Geotrypetes seraphini TaxID=260995 RepID=A0A6P8PU35_GEOSA|nr:forkhead-associated domain-containing protein 1 isoform X2 [Geotrypetes seraphini]
MKGFLKCSDSIFVLKPKVTTIGRHGESDLVLKSTDIEEHHARIELNEFENCFVLHDLNSLYGTFVNDCHIQNAAVKLSPGDILRFGSSGSCYELLLEISSQSQHSSAILGNWIHGGNGTVPHPPNRSRSCSAGSRKMCLAFSADATKKPPANRQGNNLSMGNGASPTLDLLLQEKDQMLKMDNEAYHLIALESESKYKDVVIANLRERVAALIQQIAQSSSSKSNAGVTEKVFALEQEITAKTEEIRNLKEQLDSLQKGSSQVLCHSLSVRDCEISNLKSEGDKLRKNLSVTSGLVTTLQKEASTKEQQIIQMKLEAENLKKENREKDGQLAVISVKMSRMREEKREEAEVKKEVLVYKNGIKEMEVRVKELEAELQNFLKEQERLQNTVADKNKCEEKLNQDNEKKSLQLQEMGRRERLIKSQVEAFKTQITHIIFPPKEIKESISDQQITEKLRNLLVERNKLHEKTKALQDNTRHETLRKALKECQASLKISCSTDNLEREISTIHNLCVDSSLFWIQKATVEILNTVKSQQEEAEHLLQDLGIETCSLKETPLYIKSLQENLQQSRTETENLEMQLNEIQEHQTSLMQEKLDELQAKHEKQLQDKMEQFCIDKQEENKKLLDDAVALEKTKMAEAIEEEKKKMEELEYVMQQNMEDKIHEIETLNSHLAEALESMEESKKQEAVLNEQLCVWDKQVEAEIEMVQNKFERERQQELAEYKEQIKQHSHTILALESRILEVTEEQQWLEKENADLQDNLVAAQNMIDQTDPMTLTVPSGIYTIKETSAFLKKELTHAQEEILSQHGIITRLKRELADASIRMSDMSGELREKEKIELEKNQTLVRNQKNELKILREKLADMSFRMEQKTSELETAKENIRQDQKDITIHQNTIKEKTSLVEKLKQEMDWMQNCNTQFDESIKKEESGVFQLAEQGALCRGFRHDETIQKQKDALVELRIRIKEMSKAHPSKTQEHGVQSLRLLKKEILEPKPQKLLITKEHEMPSVPGDMETKVSETCENGEKSELAVERTARLEMSEALDLSEEMYFSLINVLGNLMDIKELSGLQSIKHLSQEEREGACKQRQKDIQLLSNKISQLKNLLQRKEEVLTEYDADLQELRQSKISLKMQQLDLSELEDEILRHVEENALLREALKRTELQLNQEKQINKIALQQKGSLDHLEKSESPAQEDGLEKGEPALLKGCQDLKHRDPKEEGLDFRHLVEEETGRKTNARKNPRQQVEVEFKNRQRSRRQHMFIRKDVPRSSTKHQQRTRHLELHKKPKDGEDLELRGVYFCMEPINPGNLGRQSIKIGKCLNLSHI